MSGEQNRFQRIVGALEVIYKTPGVHFRDFEGGVTR
jgi:hypothetical protein